MENQAPVFRIHRHLIDSLVNALAEIFAEGRYADKIIEKHFKMNRKWGSRDRKFFAENIYECVRWWRLYSFVRCGSDKEFDRIDPKTIIGNWAVHHVLAGNDLPLWDDLSDYTEEQILASYDQIEQDGDLAVLESVPDWMYDLGDKELGKRWPKILSSLNDKATVDIRANLLKNTRDDLKKALQLEGIETDIIKSAPDGLVLRERKNIFSSEAFKKGLFEVQDRASQTVAPLLQVQPGHRVIDACAGAGGKSLHIASFMKNKGKLIALDIHDWKLKELKTRAARGGVDVIETRVIDSSKVIKRLEASADRLLLDVPCSGMGVLRRNPDTKWKLTQSEVDRLIALQRELLITYCDMTKPGGLMVYATCSLLPSENEQQVEYFLSQKSGSWELLEKKRIDPDEGRGDGFFAAVFRRNA